MKIVKVSSNFSYYKMSTDVLQLCSAPIPGEEEGQKLGKGPFLEPLLLRVIHLLYFLFRRGAQITVLRVESLRPLV